MKKIKKPKGKRVEKLNIDESFLNEIKNLKLDTIKHELFEDLFKEMSDTWQKEMKK